MSSLALALAPLLVLLVAFEAYCIWSILREEPRILPRWAWILVCLASMPAGGIVYLLAGRNPHGASGAPPTGEPAGDRAPAGTPPGPPPAPATPDARAGRAAGDPAPAMIRTGALTKRYEGRAVLDAVDLVVPSGSVYGLVGPNGAGKTTILSVLAGLRRPDSGSVDIAAAPTRVAYLPDTPTFEPWLTAREAVELARHLSREAGGDGRHAVRAVDDVLAETGIAYAADRRTGTFSRGMLQRLGLAVTIVGAPELLLLDEPCSALDPLGRREVLDLVGRLGGDHTVLFCSHILDDVQEVCDTVGILREGRLLYQGALDDLLVGAAAPSVRVRVRTDAATVAEALRAEPWVVSVERLGAEELLVVVTSRQAGERELVVALADSGADVVSVVPGGADLERVFLELVR